MKSFLHCCFVLCLAAGLALADVSDLKSKKSVESSKPSDKSSDSKPKRDASFLVGSSYHGPSFKYLPPSTSSTVYNTFGGAHHGLGSNFGSSGHHQLPHGAHSYSGHSLGHHSGNSAGHYASHYGHSGLADVKYSGISHGSSLPSHSISSSLGNHGYSGSSYLGGHHHPLSSGHGYGLSAGHGHGLSSGHGHGLSSGHGHGLSSGHGHVLSLGHDHGLSSGHDHGLSSGHGHGLSSGHGHGLSSGHDHGLSSGHGHGLSSGHGHGLSSGHGHGLSSGHGHGISSGHGNGLSSGHGHGLSLGHGHELSSGHGDVQSSGHGHGLSSGRGHGLSLGHGHDISSGHGHGSLGPAYTAGHGLLSSGSHGSHDAEGGHSHGGHSGHSYITSSTLGGSGLAHKSLTSHANVPTYAINAGQVGTAAGLATGYHYAKGISGSLPSSSHSTHSIGSAHLGSSGGVRDFANHGIANHGFANHGFANHGFGSSSGSSSNEFHHSDHVHNGNQEHHYIVSAAHDDAPVAQSPQSEDGYHYDAPSPVYLAPPTYQQPPHPSEPSSSYGVPLATIGGSYAPIYHGQSLGDESPVYAAGHKGLGHFTYTANRPSVLHTSFVDSEFKPPNYSNAPFKPSTFLGSKVEGSSYAQQEGHGPSLQYLTPQSGSGAESNGYDYPVPAPSYRDSEYQPAADNATPIHEPESTNNLEQSYNDISSNPSANYAPSNAEHSYGTQQ